ncbi:MAG: formyl transferase, partial [Thermomicrobia bacterium]|nr:formyl transferase [Thermomicrobia bacterium]
HQGDVYCVPESGEAGEIALYKATAFPEQWTKCKTLVAGFAGLDATLFPHDGRWWLLCTEQGEYANTMLHAWHAPDLFGPWTPHPDNPLKTDVRSSRPAGAPFVHHGHLYRPAQDCSRTYGGAVTINRIVHLSPTAFAEEAIAVVAPDATGPYRYGLHTLSAFGSSTLIDGKGRSFAPAEFRRLIGTLLRRIRQRAFRP